MRREARMTATPPLDANHDGKVSLPEAVVFAQGFLSAAVSDVLRVTTSIAAVLTLAATLWNTMHPAQAVALPPAPAPVVAPDTDAPAPVAAPPAVDTDAPKAG